MCILARLMRRGCATLSPVIIEILVLSDDKIVPRSVAPLGRADCLKTSKYNDSQKERKMYLHVPGVITSHPFRVYAAQSLRSSIHPARRKIHSIMKERVI
jgi:hypothetical protein